ncbi:MAG: FAD-dependent oxidoreductase, partial [Ancalomicrobiaceae bacterium]|nr:FAD-dependent oxidoreductase [Ancalomicrobiaceae bacterium]
MFEYDGETVEAAAGESVAAALVAHGRLTLSSAPDGAARGIFCGMGVCHDCRVTIDGRAGQRACLVKVAPGMRIASSPSRPRLDADADLAARPEGPIAEESVDVLVVGAGPAGLAAATAARTAGASAIIVDERPIPGGQFYKQPARSDARVADAQARAGAGRIAAATHAGVEIRSRTIAWGGFREAETLVIGTFGDGCVRYIRPRALIIACGAYEQPGLFPGWTLPGAMTTGALQTLLRGEGRTPPGRILVAGNGPLNLQVAAELVRAGGNVVGIVEAAPAPWTRPLAGLALIAAGPTAAYTGLQHLAKLRLNRIPVFWGSRLTRLDGSDRVETAVVTDGRGRKRTLAVDLVAVNEGFSPANELARLLGVPHRVRRGGFSRLEAERGNDGSTPEADIFVVGEAGGFGGAPVAESQGRLAGLEAARRLGFTAADDPIARRALQRHRRFQAALWRLFAAEDAGLSRADADTIVCRCEQVSLGAVQAALAEPCVGDLAGLKRLTRVGMGRCQGRYCMARLATLLPDATTELDFPAPQMPLKPIPAAALASEKSEWAGHRRAMLPPAPQPRERSALPVTEAEVVVIGAGIAGLSTALFLARGGADVVILDRGQPNGRASGGNAGSLHGQLLSFDFGAKAEAGGSPAARTLALQRDSIALWVELERELAADFDITLT